MNIYVLTQEDAFYIPVMLDHLLEARRDVIGVGIVPGELQASRARRYLRLMGVRDFALQSLNLVRHRALDLWSRVGPVGRSYSVAGAARRHGVAAETVPKVNAPEFVAELARRHVDLIVSIACPQLLKRPILELPAHGCINVHGALLPRYQGMLPSFWVLAKGETETGVTVHYMAEQVDAGAVIRQTRVPIRPGDTVHTLVRRSKVEVGKELLVEAIAAIEAGRAAPEPMDLAAGEYYSFPDDAAVAEFRSRGRRFI